MLTGLSIRDVVLIERLDLTLSPGLNALTGETGAGKSILLDALGLALGNRSEAGLIRRGAAQASVSATFEPPSGHAVNALLAAQSIPPEDTLILRRIVTPDGRSRAFINDQPCSLALMKAVAASLVETHGQFDTGALLDRETHRATLDGFARLDKPLAATQAAWRGWQAARSALQAAEETQQRARAEETFLREALANLDELDPQPGEETELDEKRARLANRDRIIEALNGAATELSGPRGAETALNNARRLLDRITQHGGAQLAEAVEALQRAAVEIQEAGSILSAMLEDDGDGGATLEKVDDRLFALRGAARRFGVELSGLSALRDDFRARLNVVDDGGATLAKLARDAADAKAVYEKAAAALTASRTKAAKSFDKAIAAELPPLKLDKARIETRLEPLPEPEWGANGVERVSFLVATNPGAQPGPLAKIASGGELSRFMLALKVVLAGVSDIPVLVFDEVDSGIGGATADAVGERLKKLGQDVQVLVVTHSPQVAARADRQWRVEKTAKGQSVTTDIVPLDPVGRLEEIARMLSGATITDEARAAAGRLLDTA
jgi:DNA repair protein RecN (Recombination protein N)